MVDAYTRYLMAIPVKNTELGPTYNAFANWFKTFGKPKKVKTNNGPPFNGKNWEKSMTSIGIEVNFSTPLDSQQTANC